jgi:hypothetical protein
LHRDVSHRLPPSGVRLGWVWPDPSGSGLPPALRSERFAVPLFGAALARNKALRSRSCCNGVLRNRVAATEPFGAESLADGLFGVRRHDRRLFGVGGQSTRLTVAAAAFGPARRQACQGDPSGSVQVYGRSGGLKLSPGLWLNTAGARPSSEGHRPFLARGLATWGALRSTPCGLSSGHAMVRLRASRMHVPQDFGGCLRIVRPSSFGSDRICLRAGTDGLGSPQAFGPRVCFCRSCCFGSLAALGRLVICAAADAAPSGAAEAATTTALAPGAFKGRGSSESLIKHPYGARGLRAASS